MIEISGDAAGALLTEWDPESVRRALTQLAQPAHWERASQIARQAAKQHDAQEHGRQLVALYEEVTTP